jgi:hypothetical protein
MSPIVSLRDVVNEMDTMSEGMRAFINRKTGELFSTTDEYLPGMDDADDEDFADAPDWQKEMLTKAREVVQSEDWLQLPTGFDLDEYRIMRDFAATVANRTLAADLQDTIGGRGTFGRFKGMCERHGILDDYYRFRSNALGRIAADFLDANGIAYDS